MREFITKCRVFYITLFFNRYSERYFNLLVKTIRNSVTYIREFQYLTSIDIRQKVTELVANEERLNNIPVYMTSERIRFGRDEFSRERKHLHKNKVKPDFVIFERFENDVFTVYNYQEQLFNKKLKRNYYFLDDSLFMGEILIQNDGSLAKNNSIAIMTWEQIRGSLIDDLFKRYNITAQDRIPVSFIIKNDYDELIYFVDMGFFYQIRYFSRMDPAVNQVLSKMFDNGTRDSDAGADRIHSIFSGEMNMSDHLAYKRRSLVY
jgi:hypothetical protein